MIEPAPAFYWRQMTTSKTWEQWEGVGYPASRSDSVIYYFPGKVNIEDQEQLDALALVLRMDGVAPSLGIAYESLEDAIVVHGQTVNNEGELTYFRDDEDLAHTSLATWVEVTEYDD